MTNLCAICHWAICHCAICRSGQRQLSEETGANLVLIALMMTGLLGFTGLAIDGSNLYYQQQRMQIAADAAALGGARLLALETGEPEVNGEIRTLAFANAADTVDWRYISGGRGVNVLAQRTFDSYFARMFGYETFTARATSEAQWEPISETEGLFPMTLSCDCVEDGEIIYVNDTHGFTTGDDSTPDYSEPQFNDASPQTVLVEFDDSFESAYEFTFVSLVDNTWTYQVREVQGRDLSHWLLEIPTCLGNITAYTPAGAAIGIDGSTGYAGIKWDVNDSFSQGLFSFTLDGAYPIGVVSALAKAGSNFGTTAIKGPICDGSDPNVGAGENDPALCLPTIDFERDDSGGSLMVGQKIVNQWAAWGVHVSTHNPSAHPAMIFGSGNPTGNDWHLGTSNEGFGGPGRGSGGAPGMPGVNSVPQNNVLIISEDGNSANPDDNAGGFGDDGGHLVFTFDMPVRMDEVQLVGIGDDQGAGKVTLYEQSGGGDPLTSRHMLGLGPNSFQIVPLDAIGVRRMEISLPRGGAVTSVVFCRSQQEPRYRIGDLIWSDTNGNGQVEEDEIGVAGVKVELYVAGQAGRVAWTETDASGHYLFANLPPGDYEVKLPASNFEAGAPLENTLYTPGNRFEASTGSATVTLPGPYGDDLDVDGGFMPQPGEPIFEGPTQGTVILYDDTQSTYEFTLVEHNGPYWRYRVREVQGRDLSHWNLLIGNCVTPDNLISGYSPSAGGSTGHDGSTNTWGIKWDLSDRFSVGEFSFTLDKNYHPAVVQVLAKAGPTHASVEIIGPDCSRPVQESASAPTPTPVPTPDPDEPGAGSPGDGDPQMCSFGWLDWNGGVSPNLELHDNMLDTRRSGAWEIGQVIPTGPAVSNSALISSALNQRRGDVVKIPLSQFDGNGYAICGFAYVRLVDYQLEEGNRWFHVDFLRDLIRGLASDPAHPDYGARDVRMLR